MTADRAVSASVPVYWRCGPAIQLSPRVLFFSNVAVRATVDCRVSLVSSGSAIPRVRAVEVDGRAVDFREDEVARSEQPARSVCFSLRSGSVPGIGRHSATLVLDDKSKSRLSLPITPVTKNSP
jgi:hypothetical protein